MSQMTPWRTPRLAVLIAALALGGALIGLNAAQGPESRVQKKPVSAQKPPASNSVTAGELIVDPPTLINLGFEWPISGDRNRNASVAVSYRKVGATAWRQALPLLRLQGEEIDRDDFLHVEVPNMFAGSVLDLEPGTAYQVRLVLSDPDGVTGERTQLRTVWTRREPVPFAGGRVFHVYPPGTDKKPEGPFEGLMCAYNLTCSGTDWATAGRPRVRPGDTILVHAGVYKYERRDYTNERTGNRTVPQEGTYYLTADGTAERPIVIKAAGDGEVVFDGGGNATLFNVMAADYTYFEGITFRNTDTAISAGTQFIAGSKGLTVKRCRFENVSTGVFTNYSGSSNFYIADSWFIGRHDPERLIAWADAKGMPAATSTAVVWSAFDGVDGQKFPPGMPSYVAVKIYGQGHVVAHNYVANFHDGLNVETYGNPDGSSAADGPWYPPRAFRDRRPVSIDFYNNLLTNFHDNPIETDGGMHNIRVLRNLMLNSALHAFNNQPVLGGPAYWIGNIAYNLPGGSTRLTNGSAGVLFYNNTIVSETVAQATSNTHWRNNLILGQNTGDEIFSVTTFTAYTSSDYNGFRPNPGKTTSFRWAAPPSPRLSDYTDIAKLDSRGFATLGEYQRATGQDQHSVLVDYDVFVNVPRLDARDTKNVQRVYRPENLDFSLQPDSAAIDRGVVLPNVTDGFTGKAPDLGALERGRPVPVYGPRR